MAHASCSLVLCNGASMPTELEQANKVKPLCLEYRDSAGPNVRIALPDFVRGVYYLPNRILDLLEIASYIFSADRLVSRGDKDAVEYHSWSRSFHFVIKVRDFAFWQSPTVQGKLSDALQFMSGDREFKFTFQSGHTTPPTSLFDNEQFIIELREKASIVLFSGGLDSFAGIIERLENTSEQLYLVSHRSGQPGTAKTQDQLFSALYGLYGDRVKHYKFRCGLRSAYGRAIEETQRTRAFLFSSIAYALSHALSQDTFYVYENGITSINFPKRQDLMYNVPINSDQRLR